MSTDRFQAPSPAGPPGVTLWLGMHGLLQVLFFLLNQYAYSWLFHMLNNQTNADLPTWTWHYLAYALVFGLSGIGLLTILLPRLTGSPGPKWSSHLHVGSHSLTVIIATCVGISLFFWLLAHLLNAWQDSGAQSPSLLMAQLYKNSGAALAHFLLAVVWTPVIEEFYYRRVLTGWTDDLLTMVKPNLDRARNGSAPATSLSDPARRTGRMGLSRVWQRPEQLFYLLPALLFALGHPGKLLFMLALGGALAILFLRFGLVAAVMTHSAYNALIWSSAWFSSE
ncbi:MAG: CPBP family intramembrane metalloprotease [Leptospiraceae bacterium]|nr:CPBP family intramembrane metalloprotease [Leptospiraceae bacterium]